MKTLLRWLSVGILLVNGATALVGGATLVNDPSGHALGLPHGYIEGTAFNSYMWPGYFLFLLVGVFSLLVAYQTASQEAHYPIWIMAEGGIQLLWVTLQLAVIPLFNVWLHLVFLVLAAALMWLGFMLRKIEIAAGRNR
jgi:hypothetical protein